MQAIKCMCIVPSTCSRKIFPYLSKCINSLRAASKKSGVDIKILVVSGNKTANPKSLKAKIDEIVFVDENAGFAEMNNWAIYESMKTYQSDYQLLINDDAWVREDFFKVLTGALKGFQADIIVPLVYTSDKKIIDSFGVEYFTSGYAKNSIDLKTPTTLASAGCLFVKTSLLRKMKGIYGFCFNSALFYYLEDVEFSIRALAIGAKIKKETNLVAYHHGSLTAGRKSYFSMYQTYRNIIWLILLTWPIKVIIKNWISVLVVQGWVIFYSLVSWGPGLYLKLCLDTLKNFNKIMHLRKGILKSYGRKFDFYSLFSKYAFRTYHGITIKI